MQLAAIPVPGIGKVDAMRTGDGRASCRNAPPRPGCVPGDQRDHDGGDADAKRRATYNGKIQIGTKEELKNHLGRSPDRADAVVLAFSGWTPRKARSTEAVHWG